MVTTVTAADELSAIYAGTSGAAALAWIDPRGAWHEQPTRITDLPVAVSDLLRSRSVYAPLYVSQHVYSRLQRTTDALAVFTSVHLDLDVYDSPLAGTSVPALVAAVLRVLDQIDCPHPSYIVNSGRGLQVKWLLTQPLTRAALPRWRALERFLTQQFEAFAADEKGTLPTQMLRLLGGLNFKTDPAAPVAIVWGSLDVRVSFEDLAAVLPYRREQVAEFRERMATYDAWASENAANRARAAAAGMRGRRTPRFAGLAPAAQAVLSDQVAGEIWLRRLDVMTQLHALRYTADAGVTEGLRSAWLYVAGAGLHWAHGNSVDTLRQDIVEYAAHYMPTFTRTEALGAVSAVLRRAASGQQYRFTEARFRSALGITDAERAVLASAKAQPQEGLQLGLFEQPVREGAMGFEKMRGLSFEDYQAETLRRQQEAGRWSAAQRAAKSADARAEALRLRAEGATQAAIAGALGVHVNTVAKWLKAR